MVTITIHNMTDLYAVGFESNDRNEVIHQYYSMWNLKATKGQLFWLCEREGRYFAFIYCAPAAFYKWLTDSSIRIYGNSVKKIRSIGKAKRAIKKIIVERKAAVKYDNFVTYGGKNTYVYQVADKHVKKMIDFGTETIDTRGQTEAATV